MGTNSSKNKTILEILKLLSTNSKKNSRENLKIEYNINYLWWIQKWRRKSEEWK